MKLHVIDKCGTAMYGNSNTVLELPEDVQVEKTENGLAIVELSTGRKHNFNKEGE
jgi:hypothetical protein